MSPEHDFKSTALQELQARGFLDNGTDLQGTDETLSKGPVTFYVGYDPTGVSLHVGHLTCIMAQRVLQRHGHRPLVLLGGGTAQVGDPSGKSSTRKVLDPETVASNLGVIRGCFDSFLDFEGEHSARILNNEQWLSGLGYLQFLREIGSQFSVNRMVAAKTYRDRLDQELPLSFLEFNYQLLQAYDFLHLSRKHGCTLQLGGSDQWGNMVAGVDLVRRLDGKTVQAMTWPLLVTSEGTKMGKTENGAVWISPVLCSAFDYFQFWLSCSDPDVEPHLLKFTDLDPKAVRSLCEGGGKDLCAAKETLAYLTTELVHGSEEAQQARDASRRAFTQGSADWTGVPTVGAPTRVLWQVVKAARGVSGREARALISNGAVRVGGELLKDPKTKVLDALPLRLSVGKRRFQVLIEQSVAP